MINGHIDIVAKLLNAPGIDVNAQDEFGKTARGRASQIGRGRLVLQTQELYTKTLLK